MTKRNASFAALAVIALASCASPGTSPPATGTSATVPRAGTFRNPLRPGHSADPWIVHANGFYHLLFTSGTDQIVVRRAASLAGLSAARDVVLFDDPDPRRNKQVWAPELHFLDGRWYLYYTASDGVDDNHRLYVLESRGADPMGPYSFKGQLATDPDNRFYAIDAHVLRSGGRLYLLWAGRPGHVLFIAPMSDPWTVSGPRVHLPASGFGCEEVREGPVTLRRQGRIYLTYSACDTGKPDYKLGMLVADDGADLLDPRSWRQHPAPVLTRNDAAGVYGPGHHGFFKSPDGREDWIVYHAKTTDAYTYAGRTARAERFTWNPDGTPRFSPPAALDTDLPLPSGDPGSGSR